MKIKFILALFLSTAFATLTNAHDFGYKLPAKCSFDHTLNDGALFWIKNIIGPIPDNQNYEYWGSDFTETDCKLHDITNCLTAVTATIKVEQLDGIVVERSTQWFIKRIKNRVQGFHLGGDFYFSFEGRKAAEVLGQNPKIVECYIQ